MSESELLWEWAVLHGHCQEKNSNASAPTGTVFLQFLCLKIDSVSRKLLHDFLLCMFHAWRHLPEDTALMDVYLICFLDQTVYHKPRLLIYFHVVTQFSCSIVYDNLPHQFCFPSETSLLYTNFLFICMSVFSSLPYCCSQDHAWSCTKIPNFCILKIWNMIYQAFPNVFAWR